MSTYNQFTSTKTKLNTKKGPNSQMNWTLCFLPIYQSLDLEHNRFRSVNICVKATVNLNGKSTITYPIITLINKILEVKLILIEKALGSKKRLKQKFLTFPFH